MMYFIKNDILFIGVCTLEGSPGLTLFSGKNNNRILDDHYYEFDFIMKRISANLNCDYIYHIDKYMIDNMRKGNFMGAWFSSNESYKKINKNIFTCL